MVGVIIVGVFLRRKRLKASRQETTYNSDNNEMKMKTNEAYNTVTSEVITSTNPAYVTTASVPPNGHSESASRESGTEDIANVAYERTDPTTSDNPAYTHMPPQKGGDDTLEYDYIK